jgi:hypothetical protein
MSKMIRRSFLKSRVPIPASTVPAGGLSGAAADDGASRRTFLQGTAGAAAGAALVLVTPKVASIALDAPGSGLAAEPAAVVTKPSGPAPHEPVTAYVRNAERGEVTVMSGKRETTYRDHVLVKRLLDAAH